MMPLNGKPWRRGLRRAKRGETTGRRVTHRVETTYGRHQRERDWHLMWQAQTAALLSKRQED